MEDAGVMAGCADGAAVLQTSSSESGRCGVSLSVPPLFRLNRDCLGLVLEFAAGKGGAIGADLVPPWARCGPREPPSSAGPHLAVGLTLVRTCRAALAPSSPLRSLRHGTLQFAVAIDDHRATTMLGGATDERAAAHHADQDAPTATTATRRFLLVHTVRLTWTLSASAEHLLRTTRRIVECGILSGLRDLRLVCHRPPTSSPGASTRPSVFDAHDVDTLADAINELHQLQVLVVRKTYRAFRLPFGRLGALRSLHTLHAPLVDAVSRQQVRALIEADVSGLCRLPALTDLVLDELDTGSLNIFISAFVAASSAATAAAAASPWSPAPPRLKRIRIHDLLIAAEESFVQLARLPSLTDLDTEVPFQCLDAIASLSQLRILKCGAPRFGCTRANASQLANQLDRSLPALHQLEELTLEVPWFIRPDSHRDSVHRSVFTASLLLSALRGSRRLTALTLRWPHLTSADVAAVLALPMPLRRFQHHWYYCEGCYNPRHRCSCVEEQDMYADEQDADEQDEQEPDVWPMNDPVAHADPAAAAAAAVAAAGPSARIRVVRCTTLTDVQLFHERFTSADLAYLLRAMPCVRRLHLELPRLTHLRAFAQAGVAPQLEDLIIDDEHFWYSTTHRTITLRQQLVASMTEPMRNAHAERKAIHQAVADAIHRRQQQSREQLAAQLADELAADEHGDDGDVEIDFTNPHPSLPLYTAYRASVDSGATLLAPVVQLPSIRRIVIFGADVPFLPSLPKDQCGNVPSHD